MKPKTTRARTTRDARYADARPIDAAEYLVSEAQVAAYLDAALEQGDPAFFREALGTVARARGMTRIAEQTDSTRAGLYKALKGSGNPEFGTIQRVVNALGYRLRLVRLPPGERSTKPRAAVAKRTRKRG